MKIRKMRPEDASAVIAIESESYKNPISQSELLNEIKTKGQSTLAPIVTCNDAGDVVGYLLVGAIPGKSLALTIVSTKKGCERQGVALRMIERAKDAMKSMRLTSIVANVHQDRVAAQKLLAKAGFVCTGTYMSEMDDEEFEVCKFSYSVPMDDLSNRHIARIAKECREARASKQKD